MKAIHPLAAGTLLVLATGLLPPLTATAATNAPGATASAKSTGTTAAPAAAPQLPKLSAQQIVERNVAARGGAAAWRAIRTIAYEGSLDAGKVRPDNGMNPASKERIIKKPGKSTKIAQAPEQHTTAADAGTPVSLPYTLYLERPRKQRMEIKFKDETLVQVYDGKNGWKVQPYLHRGVLPFSRDELKQAEEFQEIEGPLVDYAAKGTNIALDGTELVEGSPAYRLKLTLRNGDVRHVWIDGASFLEVQVDGTRQFNGHAVPQITALRDYRSVSGVKVPYVMETRIDGIPDRHKIVVEKVALNPALDDALFSKPN